MSDGPILVQVVPATQPGREIGWRSPAVADQLDRRLDDIKAAVATGTRAVGDSLPTLPEAAGWEVKEVSASFGITLTAEAGALITKASAGATFEVSVTFQRHPTPDDGTNTR